MKNNSSEILWYNEKDTDVIHLVRRHGLGTIVTAPMEKYGSEGNIINSTGYYGYIYRLTLLENIADLLQKECKGQNLVFKDGEDLRFLL